MRTRFNILGAWLLLAMTALSALASVIGGFSSGHFGLAHAGLQALAHTIREMAPNSRA